MATLRGLLETSTPSMLLEIAKVGTRGLYPDSECCASSPSVFTAGRLMILAGVPGVWASGRRNGGLDVKLLLTLRQLNDKLDCSNSEVGQTAPGTTSEELVFYLGDVPHIVEACFRSAHVPFAELSGVANVRSCRSQVAFQSSLSEPFLALIPCCQQDCVAVVAVRPVVRERPVLRISVAGAVASNDSSAPLAKCARAACVRARPPALPKSTMVQVSPVQNDQDLHTVAGEAYFVLAME